MLRCNLPMFIDLIFSNKILFLVYFNFSIYIISIVLNDIIVVSLIASLEIGSLLYSTFIVLVL